MITAPFNFVPLNEKVFYPPWADDVSHDIPFEDGESGVIDITITAKSPIFIKDGKKNSNQSQEFCNHNGKYYIPGSSVKGMIRNVLEIMSFSKMSFVDDKTYSLRDIKYDKYMEKSKNVKCGWLYYENNQLKIEDCGEPFRISYDEIDRHFNINFKTNFLIKQDTTNKWDFKKLYSKLDKNQISDDIKDEYDKLKKSSGETAKDKFAQKLRDLFLTGSFDDIKSPYKKAFEKYNLLNSLTNQDIFTETFKFKKKKTDGANRVMVGFDNDGNIEGKLVLTGHPSSRVENKNSDDIAKLKISGKIYDFVFPIQENPQILDVDDKVFENFKFAYFDGRDTQPKESEDWRFWKVKLYNGEKIPVFFHKDITGKVMSFGLSYLYKLPFEKSILDAIYKSHTSLESDLAQAIFGYTQKIDNKQQSLKGRVQFSHARAINNPQPLNLRYVLLGTPKASYYPIYLVQNGKEYKTLMDDAAILAGWKRYPVHDQFKHRCQGESTQTTLISPLDKGAKFGLKVRFHNLKKVEIGALLSSLTFHNNSNTYFHSLGMAKSYGYGKVQLKIENIHGLQYELVEYVKAFESALNSEVFDGKIKWHESEQIQNLFSMAFPQDDSNLEYMELKDFAKEKNDKNYLDKYINLDGVKLKMPNCYADDSSIKEYIDNTKETKEKWMERKRLKEIEKEQKIQQERQKQEEQNAWQKANASGTIPALENFIDTYPNSNHVKEAEQTIQDIKKAQQQGRIQALKNEIAQKWQNIQSVEQKHKLKAFQDFIVKYPEHNDYMGEAQSIIEELSLKARSSSAQSIDSLKEANDTKKFKSILETNKDSLNEHKELIKQEAIRLYRSLKGKKQKNFFKEVQLGRFVDPDFEQDVKENC